MQSSLYDRLGGKDAITAVVDDFVAGCANADQREVRRERYREAQDHAGGPGVRGHGRAVYVLRPRHEGNPQGDGCHDG